MGKIIGIDLGASSSVAAVMIGAKPSIIPAVEGTYYGGKAFPSVVAFTREGQPIVGEAARRQMISNPEGTIVVAKRKMGADFKFDVFGREYTPEYVSSLILQKMKSDAELSLGESIDRAVITVPAYFDENQRQAIKQAAELAGLNVARIIIDSTAVSLTYGLDKPDKDLKIMVFDLGGEALNVTVMEMGGGVFQVKSTSGDTGLGGTDMDDTLANYILEEFQRQSGFEVKNDNATMMRIREAAGKAKIELSNVDNTEINLPFLAYDPAIGPKNLVLNMPRTKLEELLRPIIEKCRKSIVQALKDAWLTAAEIDKVILSGGLSRMPMVRNFVATVMGKEPEGGIDPMEAVALGAAIQGAVITGEVSTDILLVDVTPLTLGVEVLGGLKEVIIERNTTIPTRKSEVFATLVDEQRTATVHVIQGDRDTASDCVSLGTLNLHGISLAPKGVPQIEVTLDIDANGIIDATARDLITFNEARNTLPRYTKLSNDIVSTKTNLTLMERPRYIPKKNLKGKKKGIIISVTDYDNRNLPNLTFCRKNGENTNDLLKSIGYQISNDHKLIGDIRFDEMRDALFSFFYDNKNSDDDILLVYYSGYCIPDYNAEDIFLIGLISLCPVMFYDADAQVNKYNLESIVNQTGSLNERAQIKMDGYSINGPY